MQRCSPMSVEDSDRWHRGPLGSGVSRRAAAVESGERRSPASLARAFAISAYAGLPGQPVA